jgi:hypothetical protein
MAVNTEETDVVIVGAGFVIPAPLLEKADE